ncbi:MAG: molybdopterin-synthase adenylyltransferase MoeB [Coraliomargaritaceae bacterium]
MQGLNSDEMLRYQRHLSLPGFGPEAQLQLKKSSVLVIGAGGLGCPALLYLAAAGVGRIGIMDDDAVDLSNLQRQVLYTADDIGKSKAEVAAERLREQNPHVECLSYVERLDLDNAVERIGAFDLVMDGSDNFPTRYLVNDACVLAEKPFVHGAIHTFQGQVSVFNYEGGPTYRCLFPEPPNPADAPNCSEVGVVGVLPGLIGLYQATEAIKLLAGIGQPLSGRLLLLDALSMRQEIITFERDPEQAQASPLEWIEYNCGRAPSDVMEGITEVDPRQLQEDSTDYQLLDVREDWERAICALPGAHLPLGEILSGGADFGAVGLDAGKPTYVYCKAGVRSRQAAEAMQAHYGFKHLKNVQGGILAWAQQVDPSMPTY